MDKLRRKVLEQLISGSAEPVLLARTSQPDWPVVLVNPAYEALAGESVTGNAPLADVIEQLLGRDLALEVSETIRGGHETTIALELAGREYFLVLKPLLHDADDEKFYVAYWRGGATSTYAADGEIQQALLKAKRRIRDLSRDDPITGLLNEKSFREVLAHDWAVAEREKSCLALVAFILDDFDAYVEVFGRHAADSCQRRVAQAIRRCLRRASDVAAKIKDKDDEYLIVLSHASAEEGVRDFAARIATAVRDLGLHHPRSRAARYVTVSYQTLVVEAGGEHKSAAKFLQESLGK